MRGVCRDAAINAYPTVKLFTKSSKKDKSVVVEGFAAKDMVEFVNNELSSESQSVSHFCFNLFLRKSLQNIYLILS